MKRKRKGKRKALKFKWGVQFCTPYIFCIDKIMVTRYNE